MLRSGWFYVGVLAGIIMVLFTLLPMYLAVADDNTVVPNVPCVFHHSQGNSTTVIEGGMGIMYHDQFHCFKTMRRKL
jgi:hypothetical protein